MLLTRELMGRCWAQSPEDKLNGGEAGDGRCQAGAQLGSCRKLKADRCMHPCFLHWVVCAHAGESHITPARLPTAAAAAPLPQAQLWRNCARAARSNDSAAGHRVGPSHAVEWHKVAVSELGGPPSPYVRKL